MMPFYLFLKNNWQNLKKIGFIGPVVSARINRLRLGGGPEMNKIVEAVVKNGDRRVPVGLVSIKQALEMPERGMFEFSHPAYEAGKTDVFLSREALSKLQLM